MKKQSEQKLDNTISKFEDQIENTKFKVAALKIELAFRKIDTLVQRKRMTIQAQFFQKINFKSQVKLMSQLLKPTNLIQSTLQNMRYKVCLKAFSKIKIVSGIQQWMRTDQKKKSKSSTQQIAGSQLSTNTILQEQIQEQCNFLKDQIGKIQKSFQSFYNNIQQN